MDICCDTPYFPVPCFTVPHKNPHGVQGLSKRFHILLDTKLVHGKFSVSFIYYMGLEYSTMFTSPGNLFYPIWYNHDISMLNTAYIGMFWEPTITATSQHLSINKQQQSNLMITTRCFLMVSMKIWPCLWKQANMAPSMKWIQKHWDIIWWSNYLNHIYYKKKTHIWVGK